MQRKVWLALAVLLLTGGRVLAVPSPPPPSQVLEKASQIVTPPKPDEIVAYGALFAADVQTYFSGELIAHDRATWLRIIAGPAAEHIRVSRLATGNPIIAVEEVSTAGVPEFHGSVIVTHDCCMWARTTSFHLNSKGEVDEVRITDGQSDWLLPSMAGQRR